MHVLRFLLSIVLTVTIGLHLKNNYDGLQEMGPLYQTTQKYLVDVIGVIPSLVLAIYASRLSFAMLQKDAEHVSKLSGHKSLYNLIAFFYVMMVPGFMIYMGFCIFDHN